MQEPVRVILVTGMLAVFATRRCVGLLHAVRCVPPASGDHGPLQGALSIFMLLAAAILPKRPLDWREFGNSFNNPVGIGV